ncbi:MAG: phenylalanine--tRNA ligase subunit beta, partial [Eubacteriales bacterium]|nr:phenylalanine--tRNA ligase subunit beta [Eubacteriales bacterium]
MKASLNWLKSYVHIDQDPETFASRMVMSGSEVESIETLSRGLERVVVGRIEKLEPHPNSDHLQICTMNVGQAENVIILTGAPNVFEGALVPAALDGADLPCGIHIKPSKLRGMMSYGMLCSGEELCIGNDIYPGASVDGILILQEEYAPGTPIAEVLGLNDTVLDFKLYANRSDCQSIFGLAREAAAVLGHSADAPDISYTTAGGDVNDYLNVTVEAPDLCPRYMARVIKNIRIAPSPAWMRQRLAACGVRPINNVVDITNYVMLELGQPMHAFDYRHLQGGRIVVRRAKAGESIVTLDEKERQLDPSMLVIADESKPTAVAGIMGGEFSGILEDTQTVVFESATFQWSSVRVTSRTLGLRSESSARYEKGLSPRQAQIALDRACALVELLGCGEVVSGTVDICAADLSQKKLEVSVSRIQNYLGQPIPAQEMARLLKNLGFGVNISDDTLSLDVPWWRGDMDTYADIAEEVMRLYGYDTIPSIAPPAESVRGGRTPRQKQRLEMKKLCKALGFYEAVHYSFLAPADLDKLSLEQDDPRRSCVRLLNPLGEDYSLMRTTLIPAVLHAVAFNLNRKAPEVRLFEQNRVFIPKALPLTELPDERDSLCLAVAADNMDFFTFKGYVEAVCASLKLDGITVIPGEAPYLHPGRRAKLMLGEVCLGEFGQVHPDTAQAYDLDRPVYLAELDLQTMMDHAGTDCAIKPLPKYPATTRDLAVTAGKEQLIGPMMDCIRAAGGDMLEDVTLFDVYEGHQVGQGKKSVAFSMTFRSADHTLVDDEVNK